MLKADTGNTSNEYKQEKVYLNKRVAKTFKPFLSQTQKYTDVQQ